eukprot:TRINITY_DN11763_c0_g1_i1.p1 TRINITY_DN11763_c0_g1~~TRINITY_DN11763_c0_g1_i1.p1  ORF type:complete len:157 (+),score=25.02 TRINITY_DN11763_c0_g1_i1:78-548(+)
MGGKRAEDRVDDTGASGFVLKGSEELAMDYEVFGRYERSGCQENGKPTFLGPRSEGSRPSIAFGVGGDGEPTWWIYDPSGGECFYAEGDTDLPPRTGWRKQYGEEDLEITLELAADAPSARDSETTKAPADAARGERERSRSPPARREKGSSRCPW